MGDHECMEMTWAEYRQDGNRKAFNCLMSRYMPIVISAARRIHRRTGMGDIGDLVGVGIWALWDSIEHYRVPQASEFSRYVRKRIRGEMITKRRNS